MRTRSTFAPSRPGPNCRLSCCSIATPPDGRVRVELGRAWPRARQLFYKRPVTPVELVSGVQSALLARLRQRDVRDHIAREIELRRELNHRVKNILASVSSIFGMTKRGAVSVEGLAGSFRGRLEALAKVHSVVFEATEEGVSIGDVVDLTFEPYRLLGHERIIAVGPLVMLIQEAATTLALCLHELATNAIKYGALSRPEGLVHFDWGLSDGADQDLILKWRESGGPIVEEPAGAGYGTRYLRAVLTGLLARNRPSASTRTGCGAKRVARCRECLHSQPVTSLAAYNPT